MVDKEMHKKIQISLLYQFQYMETNYKDYHSSN